MDNYRDPSVETLGSLCSDSKSFVKDLRMFSIIASGDKRKGVHCHPKRHCRLQHGHPSSWEENGRDFYLKIKCNLISIIIIIIWFTLYLFSGNHSTARMIITMSREIRSHLVESYLPSTLFVIMSWGSFVVMPEIVPGRMVLLVTTLLSLVTMFDTIR